MKFPDGTKPYGDAPYRRPRDAATLILLRHGGSEPEVLMGKRSDALAFMPGMFVFPGGRTERSDLSAPRTGSLHEGDARRLVAGMGVRGSVKKAEALAMSAIRETHEETGLFIGKNGSALAKAVSGHWRAFAENGVLPDLSALRFVARAVTPPGRVRRFDTRFFVADADHVSNPGDLVANPAEELVEVCWVSLANAHELKAPGITKTILSIVADRLKEDPDLSRDLPVPYFRARHRRFVLTHE